MAETSNRATHQDAQATIEYVLMIAVLVSIAILLVRDLIRPIMSAFTGNLSNIITNQLFPGGPAMHQSPFKP